MLDVVYQLYVEVTHKRRNHHRLSLIFGPTNRYWLWLWIVHKRAGCKPCWLYTSISTDRIISVEYRYFAALILLYCFAWFIERNFDFRLLSHSQSTWFNRMNIPKRHVCGHPACSSIGMLRMMWAENVTTSGRGERWANGVSHRLISRIATRPRRIVRVWLCGILQVCFAGFLFHLWGFVTNWKCLQW